MRFAFKTAPQNTTWPDMLAVWKEADDIDIFESGCSPRSANTVSPGCLGYRRLGASAVAR